MNRVNYILCEKNINEHFDRLRHIYPISEQDYKVYKKAIDQAWKVLDKAEEQIWKVRNVEESEIFDKAEEQAWEVYKEAEIQAEKPILALIPNCGWDRETICGRACTK